MTEHYREHDRLSAEWADGEYTGEACPNCTRHRMVQHANGRITCEKCHWEPALNGYSPDKPDWKK